MGIVHNAILIWFVALAMFAAVVLMIWAAKRPKAPTTGEEDIPVPPHRMERLRQTHSQIKPAPRRYGQKDYGSDSTSW